MKKDTVLLNVETYNELRDFKRNIEEGYTYRVEIGLWDHHIRFMGTNEALEEMSQLLGSHKEKIKKLRKEIRELKNQRKKEISIAELKAMSWWSFRKWRSTPPK